MQCPFCYSTDVEEVSDDRFQCVACEEYFDFDEAGSEYDDEETEEEEDDYFL